MESRDNEKKGGKMDYTYAWGIPRGGGGRYFNYLDCGYVFKSISTVSKLSILVVYHMLILLQ